MYMWYKLATGLAPPTSITSRASVTQHSITHDASQEAQSGNMRGGTHSVFMTIFLCSSIHCHYILWTVHQIVLDKEERCHTPVNITLKLLEVTVALPTGLKRHECNVDECNLRVHTVVFTTASILSSWNQPWTTTHFPKVLASVVIHTTITVTCIASHHSNNHLNLHMWCP